MSRTRLCFAGLFALLGTAVSAQAPGVASGDLFAKYRVGNVFRGRPAGPVIRDATARMYRTRIREGVAKGVRFGGLYEVATWGCGAGCISFAIIDAVNGKVSFFPATISQLDEAGESLTYRTNSRAVHVVGSLNEADSADRWFVWDGGRFVLVSRKPAVLGDQVGDASKP